MMLLSIIASLALAMLSATVAQAQNQAALVSTTEWSSFMSPNDLHAFQTQNDRLQIIDIRAEKYVKKGTLPGAVWLPFGEWRGRDGQPGQPIKAEDLAALLGDAGIRLDKPIAVYNHTGKTVQNGRAAIVYWILKSAGAQEISILNGGFKAWRAAELPEANAPRVLPPVKIELTYDRGWWADPVDIFAVTTFQTEGAILDARLDGQVKKAVKTGKPLMSMPMAQYIPASFFMSYLKAKNMTVPAKEKFRFDLEERGIELGSGMLISVCQTGELSALSWFYASEIVGIENVRYYPDALRGWAGDGGLMFGLRASL